MQLKKQQLRMFTTGAVVLSIIFAFLISGIRLFGFQVYGVLTGSMEPAYPVGSLVYVRKVDPASLSVNDVITFSLGRGVIATHRIVELVPDPDNPYSVKFRTKGDANDAVDNSLVSQTNVVGKVIFSIPGLGFVANFIKEPPGLYITILIGIGLIVLVFISDSSFGAANNQRRRGNAPPARRPAQSRQGGNRPPQSRQGGSRPPQSRQRQDAYPAQRRAAPQQGYGRPREQSRAQYDRNREYSYGDYNRSRYSDRDDSYSRRSDRDDSRSRYSAQPERRRYDERSYESASRSYRSRENAPRQDSRSTTARRSRFEDYDD